MLKLRRSTNERVLARHHDLAKRFPAVEPAPARNENFGIFGGDIADAEPAHAETRSAVPVRPGENTALPPAKAATPRPAAATPLLPNPIPANTVAPIPNPNPSPKVGPPFPPTIPPNMITPTVATPPAATLPVTPSVPTPPKPSTTSSTSSSASSTVLPPVVQTGNRDVSTTPSGTAAPETSASPTNATSSSSSKGLSSGAVGGIVAVVVIAALLVVGFFVRKNYQRRRALKRNTWGAGLVPSLETKRQTMYGAGAGAEAERPASPYGGVPEHARLANVPPSVMAQTPAQRALTVPPALATASSVHSNPYGAYPDLAVPATAYNASPATPVSPFAAPSLQAPSVRSLTPAAPTGELAVVARTFIPTLPDELHIANGEQIRILSAYDDGWALCANPRGEQGVVPLECLDRRGGAPTEMQLQPHSGIGNEARTSRRMSSLAPAAPGTY